MAGPTEDRSPNLLTMMQNVEIRDGLCNESLGAKPDLTCTIIGAKPNLKPEFLIFLAWNTHNRQK